MTSTRTPPDEQRHGHDPSFLLAGEPVPLPSWRGGPAGAPPPVRLDYVHFSVVMHPTRRLALITAVDVDGAELVDLPRTGIGWSLDGRLPAAQQVGPELYADNDLDRGHLVRRRDPTWGDRRVARQANVDTFSYPNAAPQAAGFNQSGELWLGLEDHLIDHAATWRRRLIVFTGPVLDPLDPEYRGVRIPLRFFKVAVVRHGEDLAATGYLLDQTPQLPSLRTWAEEPADSPPPLGPYRTFQVPIADIAAATDLDLDRLAELDRLVTVGVRGDQQPGLPVGWRRLTDLGSIVV